MHVHSMGLQYLHNVATIGLIQLDQRPQGVSSLLGFELGCQFLDPLGQFADSAAIQPAPQFGKTPQGICQRPGVEFAYLGCNCFAQ